MTAPNPDCPIYSKFEGKLNPGGKKRLFWIQDLTPDYFEEVIEHYINGFLHDELLCSYTRTYLDPLCVQDFKNMWSTFLANRNSVICLCKFEDNTTKIAGFNCLHIIEDNGEDYKVSSPTTLKVIGIMKYLMTKRNPFKEFNVSQYLSALGLYVLPEFRGERIGQHLLEVRKSICEGLGIKLTMTVFSAPAAVKAAAGAGFEHFVTENYEDLPKEITLEGIEKINKSITFMYKMF